MLVSLQKMHQNHVSFWPSFKLDSVTWVVFSVGLPHPCGSWAQQCDPLHQDNHDKRCQGQHATKRWATGREWEVHPQAVTSCHNSCLSSNSATSTPSSLTAKVTLSLGKQWLATCGPDTCLGLGVICSSLISTSYQVSTRRKWIMKPVQSIDFYLQCQESLHSQDRAGRRVCASRGGTHPSFCRLGQIWPIHL